MAARSPQAAVVTSAHHSLSRRLAAEALGTVFLLMTVVGSGIMAESLSGGNVALALLANAVATGTALVALITTFGPISGAHFNPVVTLVERLSGRMSTTHAASYAGVQVLAAIAGVVSAHLMFGETVWQLSTHVRSGGGQLWSEIVATVGLVSVITSVARHTPAAVPGVVGAYITAAYWFTASTSFANPAVTIARAFTDTFAGIRPVDVSGFVVAQLAGGVAAWACWQWLLGEDAPPHR